MRTILSMDGGGIRGFMTASALNAIEQAAGRPAAELFDLIAGTSTGGIIATAVCSGVSAHELMLLYRAVGPEMFERGWWGTVRGLWGPKYTMDALVGAYNEIVPPAKLGDAETHMLVPAYDMRSRTPHFFKSWKGGDVDMVTVAQATSAAPTYFDPVECGEKSLIDGGIFANDPTMCAITDAHKLWPGEQLRVVSIGTGREDATKDGPSAAGWGLIKWSTNIIDTLMDSASDVVAHQVANLPGVEFDRISPRYVGVEMDDASDEAFGRMAVHFIEDMLRPAVSVAYTL